MGNSCVRDAHLLVHARTNCLEMRNISEEYLFIIRYNSTVGGQSYLYLCCFLFSSFHPYGLFVRFLHLVAQLLFIVHLLLFPWICILNSNGRGNYQWQ